VDIIPVFLIEFPGVNPPTTKQLAFPYSRMGSRLYEFYFIQDKLLAKGKAGS
jgi:hypothetical protein